jgi:hypothetical protein
MNILRIIRNDEIKRKTVMERFDLRRKEFNLDFMFSLLFYLS